MPRIHPAHLHLPHLHIDGSKNMTFLYGVRVARGLVYRLAIFFLPIYLYQQGSTDPFWQFLPGSELQKGVLLLVFFYLIHQLTVLSSGISIGHLILKIGYQRALLVSSCLFAVFLSLLYVKANPGWLILLGAFINGLETNFFWNTYQTLMSKLAQHRHMGQNLGLLQFFLQLVQAMAPALGGMLVVAFGFPALFMAGLLGVLLGMMSAFQLQFQRERDRISWAEFTRWAQEGPFIRLAVSQTGRYLNDAALVFWPLYVFLILGTVDRVGFLYTLSLFIAMILSFGVGYYIDHQKNKKLFYLSGGLLSLLWLLRSQVVTFWHIVIIDTFDCLTANFYLLFSDSIFLKRSKGGQAFSFFVYREMLISVGAILFWLVVGGLFLIFTNAWTALFILAAVGVLLGLLVKENHKT